MAALRKEELVKDGKYNRSEIMRRAWAYVRSPFTTMYRNDFRMALNAAWVDAKIERERQMAEDRPIVFNPHLTTEMLRSFFSRDMRNGNVCW